MTDSGVPLHSHGQGEIGGGCDGDLTDGEQQGEHLGVPVISPHPQQITDLVIIELSGPNLSCMISEY